VSRWAGIARFGGIGDNLIAASVLHPLKRMGYLTEVITEESNHVVYLHNPLIDKLTVHRKGDLPKGDIKQWQKWIDGRAQTFDLFLHASHSCEGHRALFSHMTEFWWRPEYRRRICGQSYLETVHDIMGVPHEFGPLYFPTEEERANAAQVTASVGRYAVWIVCGSRLDKMYPYSAMAIARIIKELKIPVIAMGGHSEKEHRALQAIREHVERQNGTRDLLHIAQPKAGVEELCWPLRTSLAMVLGADLVITPDTGPAWAAALEPMPKVVMVSHASVENITKHWRNTTTLHADPQRVDCWPCHRLHDDESTCRANKEGNGAACISDISVEKVVGAVAEAWRRLPAVAVGA